MMKLMESFVLFDSKEARRIEMDKQFGYYIFLGLLIGAAFGFGLGTANGNTLLGLALGSLTGVFVGWFIAAAIVEQKK